MSPRLEPVPDLFRDAGVALHGSNPNRNFVPRPQCRGFFMVNILYFVLKIKLKKNGIYET